MALPNIIQITPVQPGTCAVYYTDDGYDKVPLACWALVTDDIVDKPMVIGLIWGDWEFPYLDTASFVDGFWRYWTPGENEPSINDGIRLSAEAKASKEPDPILEDD